MQSSTLQQLTRLADQINHVSRLLAEVGDWAKPYTGDWAPWISPFEGNFPRVMPSISEYVDEARKYIEEGRGGLGMECPFEFLLTILLDEFWKAVDQALLPSGYEDVDGQSFPSPVFYPVNYHELIGSACKRVSAWSRFDNQIGHWNHVTIHLVDEPVALLGMQKEGLCGGPMGWEWLGPSEVSPKLYPLAERGCIPVELLDSSAGLPVLIDLIRRSITAFHAQFGYCANCCIRVLSGDLVYGECATCSGVVN